MAPFVAALASAVSLLLLVSCVSGGNEGDQTPGDLLDRTFISTAVTEGGEPRPLVPDTRIKATFEERADQYVVGSQAGCNAFGADVEITADRLLVEDEVTSTAVGCPDELEEQDIWLMDFFASDPGWRLTDDRLTLTSGEVVIELEASGR